MLPTRPDISPCVSLVGIPNKLAKLEKIIHDKILLNKAIIPKSPTF